MPTTLLHVRVAALILATVLAVTVDAASPAKG
jgi:hypothetical protein